MDPSSRLHVRPARYKTLLTNVVPRVPPRYRRGSEGEPTEDELLELSSDFGVADIMNAIAYAAVVILLGMTIGRYLFDDARDPYKCAAITNEGRWLESSDPATDPLEHWQPRGCVMHRYTRRDILNCLPNRRILFVGDESMKALYYAVVDKLSNETQDFSENPWEKDEKMTTAATTTTSAAISTVKGHGGPSFTVEFVWDPYLNSTRLNKELSVWKNGSVDTSLLTPRDSVDDGYEAPALFLVGAGIWWAEREVNPNPQREWREAVDRVMTHMRFGPRPTFLGGRDSLLLAPVAHPAWEKLMPEVRRLFNAMLAVDMNWYMHQLSTIQGLDIVRAWTVAPDDAVDLVLANHVYSKYHSKATGPDGMLLLKEVADVRVDMVLNLRCNDVLRKVAWGTVDSDCCVRYDKPGWLQGLVIFCAMAIIPTVRVWRYLKVESLVRHLGPPAYVLKRFWHLSLVLGLCFYADRTPFFNKATRFWIASRFWNVMGGIGVLSLLTLRKPSESTTTRELEARILNEWKGMALAIHLVSLYLGGSTEFSTFALLFLHSIGWTIELLRGTGGAKNGVHYFAKTVVGINIIVVPMSFMTRSRYITYQMPVLYTFWFTIVYATARVYNVRNRAIGMYLLKLCVSACAVITFFFRDAVYSAVFTILRAVFRIGWDEWELRVLLLQQMWGVYFGMVVGWVYIRVFLYGQGDKTRRRRNEVYANIAALVLGASYLLMLGFQKRSSSSSSGSSGSQHSWEKKYQTYTSLARLALFGVLRLSAGLLRGRQSAVLVWLGGLEMGVWAVVNHAWLAGNGTSVLDTGIWGFASLGFVCNWVVWSVAFMFVAWGVRDVREELLRWMVLTDNSNNGESNYYNGTGGEKDDEGKKRDEVEEVDEDVEMEDSLNNNSITMGSRFTKEVGISSAGGEEMGWKARLGIAAGVVYVLNLIAS
ncbi:hypothetical protein AA313_de0210088 [Arthrobotrys entomopaga]|nr:hypothetical protein AA313_de0210088 [Arthrobotrys entomopaga]